MNLSHNIIYEKTVENLREIIRNNYSFKELYLNLLKRYDSCLIGGAIRDFCFDSTPKDLDFVINIPDKNLFTYISKFDYKINKFGGYKVILDEIIVDIWSIDNHWAFKNKILPKSVENLEHTTFYNFDSLVFNLKSDILYSNCFLDGYKKNELDITLDKTHFHQNPQITSNVYKALKLADQLDLEFSSNTIEYIQYWTENCHEPIKEFISYAQNISNKNLNKFTYTLNYLFLERSNTYEVY
ncbi:hypothetical protein [Lysinibacillus capsici]|uniref:hypothetical protein n=1 Tax=Lysinibacillus capsici TaxID=2115968 RepID=UPI002480D731|nr:hypothetical protein [Lysinibacillus capsici]